MSYGLINETAEETKKIEGGVAGISGISSRTGKEYTDREKIAICKAGVVKSRKTGASLDEAMSETSLNDIRKMFDDALNDLLSSGEKYEKYIEDVYESYVVVYNYKKSEYYKVPYSFTDNGVSLDWASKQTVKRIVSYGSSRRVSNGYRIS